MPDTLKQVLNFTAVAVGATATLPHHIIMNGVPRKPDAVSLGAAGFEVVQGLTTTTVLALRNVSNVTGDCQVLVEAWAPVERIFGLIPDDGTFTQHLTPQPFVIGGEGSAVAPPFPPGPVPVNLIIYARQTGSDTTGTGTLANPYRTFKRAIRDVPHIIPPGYQYIVDVTDLGSEAFPAGGYQLPSIHGTVLGWTFGDASTFPFLAAGALTIRAYPQPFSGIPLADTTVLGTNIVSVLGAGGADLAVVTVSAPVASWAANALKGAMLIGEPGNPSTTCVIYGSDTTHLFLCNTAAVVATAPQQDLFIVEPSATFVSAGAGNDGAGIEAVDISSLVIQGIKFQIAGGGGDGSMALAIGKAVQPFIELCDVDGLESLGDVLQLGTFSSVLRSFLDFEATGWSPRRSLVLDAGSRFLAGGLQVVRQTVFDGCAPIGPGSFAPADSVFPQAGWGFTNVLMTGSTGTTAAIDARGGGTWALESVEINDGAAGAILVTGPTYMLLNGVTGSGSAGFGISVDDGAQVRVIDSDTDITGVAGDMRVGTLAARTWLNFRTFDPIHNQYDLRTPFITNVASGLATPAGDETTGVNTGGCTGARLFHRPNPGT